MMARSARRKSSSGIYHATVYISINNSGQFVLTPIVYSGDKFEVGRSGFWGGSDFNEVPLTSFVLSKDGPYKVLTEKLEEIFSR